MQGLKIKDFIYQGGQNSIMFKVVLGIPLARAQVIVRTLLANFSIISFPEENTIYVFNPDINVQKEDLKYLQYVLDQIEQMGKYTLINKDSIKEQKNDKEKTEKIIELNERFVISPERHGWRLIVKRPFLKKTKTDIVKERPTYFPDIYSVIQEVLSRVMREVREIESLKLLLEQGAEAILKRIEVEGRKSKQSDKKKKN